MTALHYICKQTEYPVSIDVINLFIENENFDITVTIMMVIQSNCAIKSGQSKEVRIALAQAMNITLSEDELNKPDEAGIIELELSRLWQQMIPLHGYRRI